MAKFGNKTKQRRKFYPEAPPTDTKGNLQEPEHAPAPASTSGNPSDGRRRRATGRVLRFGATVHPDWKAKLDQLGGTAGT